MKSVKRDIRCCEYNVMKIMESGKWDIELMITHEYPWEKLPQAIEKASQVNEALNVVIRY